MSTFATQDGTEIYTKSWGSGRPVVLVHGWPLNADSWDPVALALAEAGFRAISYDRRGFGRSGQPSTGYDYETLSDDLAQVLAFEKVTDDAALVGFSMGGGEVVRYMARHNQGTVTQVALISSIVPGMAQSSANPDGVPVAIFAEMEQQLRSDRAHFLKTFFKQFFGVGFLDRPVSQEVLDSAWSMAMQAGLLPTVAALKAFSTTDFMDDLAAITVPALVIHGTSDQTVPIKATAHRVHEALPHAGLIEYSGEPHGVFATRTKELCADLIEFLRSRAVPERTALDQSVLDEQTAGLMAIPPL